jgi:hypothetical protein
VREEIGSEGRIANGADQQVANSISFFFFTKLSSSGVILEERCTFSPHPTQENATLKESLARMTLPKFPLAGTCEKVRFCNFFVFSRNFFFVNEPRTTSLSLILTLTHPQPRFFSPPHPPQLMVKSYESNTAKGVEIDNEFIKDLLEVQCIRMLDFVFFEPIFIIIF